MIGIDFSASNGDPSNPQASLHNMYAQSNEYQDAIKSVGSILEKYDSNNLFPTYGFGGAPSWVGGPSN
jgi:hypothetical protein